MSYIWHQTASDDEDSALEPQIHSDPECYYRLGSYLWIKWISNWIISSREQYMKPFNYGQIESFVFDSDTLNSVQINELWLV